MNKHTSHAQEIFFPILAIAFQLLCLMIARLGMKFVLKGQINWLILIPGLLLIPISILNVICLIYPHIAAIGNRSRRAQLYSGSVIKASFMASLCAKIAIIPLCILTIELFQSAEKVIQFIGAFAGALFLIPIAILLLWGSVPLTWSLILGTLFFYSLITSLFSINSILFLVFNKQMKGKSAIGYLVLLLIPFADLITTLFMLIKYAGRKS